MTVEVDVGSLADDWEGRHREVTSEAMRRWYAWAQETLSNRGDALGYEWYPLMQAMGASPPRWSERENRWEFGVPHVAAPFFEYGAEPHEIRARRAEFLAFPWPEMEGEEFGNTGMTFDEVFADTWPVVFFKSVQHPGMEETRFLRDSRDRARDWLQEQSR